MTTIQHFLLAFDHKKDRLVEQVEFGSDASAATAAYSELERKYKDDVSVDVVLVGSDSLETVRVTHSTYFEGMSASLIDQALKAPRTPTERGAFPASAIGAVRWGSLRGREQHRRWGRSPRLLKIDSKAPVIGFPLIMWEVNGRS